MPGFWAMCWQQSTWIHGVNSIRKKTFLKIQGMGKSEKVTEGLQQ